MTNEIIEQTSGQPTNGQQSCSVDQPQAYVQVPLECYAQPPPQVVYINPTDVSTPHIPTLLSTYATHRDVFFYSLISFLLVFYVCFSIGMFIVNIIGGVVMVAATVFIFALIFSLMPRRIELWSDSLRVRFFCGFSVTTPFCNIVGVERLIGCTIFTGLKFGTSFSNRVAVYRRNSCYTALLITPDRADEFVAELRSLISPYTAQPMVYVV